MELHIGKPTGQLCSQPMTKAVETKLVRALSAWFKRAARTLPWRKRRTGYTALVSEAMLQQTQVARVAERYPQFLRRFPNVTSLANASENDVLELWQGMGYYRRARNLQRAAKHVVDNFQGRVPSDVESLRGLPGVGRYTAGAIASIAFGKHEPIVDGNVARVLARLFAMNSAPVDSAQHVAWTWETAERLVQLADEPGVFNEGLMELGATVCMPRSPKCEACPLAELCAAKKRGLQNEIPAAKARAKPQAWVHHSVVVLRGNGEVLVEQRPTSGMWAGLWQVPTIEGEQELSPRQLAGSFSFAVSGVTHIGAFEHLTTHRHITFHVFSARTRIRTGKWVDPHSAEMAKLPMSAAQRRVLRIVLESR